MHRKWNASSARPLNSVKLKSMVFFLKRHLCTEMRFYLITFLKFYYRYLLCKVSYFTFFVPFLLNDRSALSINTIVNIFDICLFLLFAFLPDLHAYSKLASCGIFRRVSEIVTNSITIFIVKNRPAIPDTTWKFKIKKKSWWRSAFKTP